MLHDPAHSCRKVTPHSAATMIGIGGGSASGKTLLAHALASAAQAAILSQDAYYRDGLSAAHNFDDPECIEWAELERHLSQLRGGNRVFTPQYNFVTHMRVKDGGRLVDPAGVILVEGLHVLARPEIRRLMQLALYVHTPPDLRLLRRIRRDIADRGRSVASVMERYESHVRPMHLQHVEPSRCRADLVVDGTLGVNENMRMIHAFAGARGIEL